MKHLYSILFVITTCLFTQSLWGIVKYDEGSLVVEGIQLLQDDADENAYYYIPPFPRLSSNAQGDPEFTFIKYVGNTPEENGAIMHALVEFSLPPKMIESLDKTLKRKKGKEAYIAGQVPMMEVMKDGEEGMGGFNIVSAVLSDKGERSMVQNVVTSGHAPFLPGSKAAIAANINQKGATIMMESFKTAASDISVSVSGYYEAKVNSFNAKVTASSYALYEHLSTFDTEQYGFYREQIEEVVDSLITLGDIQVEVFDRESDSDQNKGMQDIVDLVVEKLTALMFDTNKGWQALPEKAESVAEEVEVPDKMERDTWTKVFDYLTLGPASGILAIQDNMYVPDWQYHLKDISYERSDTFRLNLTKGAIIKVPVASTGNLGGVYSQYGQNDKHFRVVNLNDADFEKQEICFQIDGAYIDSFNDIVNFGSVSFRKKYSNRNHSDITKDLDFNGAGVDKGEIRKVIHFPRLGEQSADWKEYEYQIRWNLKGSEQVIRYPKSEDQWIQSHDEYITMKPPFQKRVIELDANRSLFEPAEVASCNVQFASTLGGSPQMVKSMVLRSNDAESTNKVAIYSDPSEEVAYRITWYSNKGKCEKGPFKLENNYLFLIPPSPTEFK